MLTYPRRRIIYAMTLATGLALAAKVALALGTAEAAKAMLDKTVAALTVDRAKTLDEINSGQNGFLQGDIYAFCWKLSDGKIVAVGNPSTKALQTVGWVPSAIGKDIRTVKDPSGDAYGARLYAAAKAGQINKVSYNFPKPGTDKTPVPKESFVATVNGLGCAVGYYK